MGEQLTMGKMKVCILSCSFMLLCFSGCFSTVFSDIESSSRPDTHSQFDEPFWAESTQSDGQSYVKLNLDGIGENDDSIFMSIYRWGDSVWGDQSSAIVLRVHLGTGETLSSIIPVAGDYSLQTGKLFSTKKDAVIIEVEVPHSNYSAANIFVFDIYGTGEVDPFPSIVERLNTYSANVVLSGGEELPSESLESGTIVTNIGAHDRQGLILFSTGSNAEFQELQTIVYWDGSAWSKENVQFE